MNIIIGIIKVLFLLGFLVFIHEGGHFLVAKICKVKVNEFSIGFGPKIYSKQGKNTKYSIRAIPLGGYVDLLGEEKEINEEGSFSNSKVSKRIAIVLAGAIVNIVFAIVLYFSLMFISAPNATNVVKQVIPEYSSNNPLESGDKILEINGEKVRIKSDVDDILYSLKNSDVNILVERNGIKNEVNTQLQTIDYNGITRYILGVEVERADPNLKNNMYYSFWETIDFLTSIGDSLKQLFTGNVGVDQMTGPIGISEMVVRNKRNIQLYISISTNIIIIRNY